MIISSCLLVLLTILSLLEGQSSVPIVGEPCWDFTPHSFTTAHLLEEYGEFVARLERLYPEGVAIREKLPLVETLLSDMEEVIRVNEDRATPESVKYHARQRSCWTVWICLRGGLEVLVSRERPPRSSTYPVRNY
jgi:hypothetical protein